MNNAKAKNRIVIYLINVFVVDKQIIMLLQRRKRVKKFLLLGLSKLFKMHTCVYVLTLPKHAQLMLIYDNRLLVYY